jgi:hypothetical protein
MNKEKPMNKLSAIAPLGLLVLAVAGCGGHTSTNLGLADNPRVRMMNAMPGETSVNGDIGGHTEMHQAGFGVASGYGIVSNGTHTGEFKDSASQGLIVSEDDLYETNKFYTVVGAGASGNRVIFRIEDDRADPDAGSAKVRVINADQTAGTVDVFITPPSQDDLTGVTPTNDDQAFETIGSGSSQRAAGTYRIRVFTSDDSTKLVDQNVVLQGGQIRTLVLVAGGSGMQIVVLSDKN